MRLRTSAAIHAATALLCLAAGCDSAAVGAHPGPTAAATVTLDDRSPARTVTVTVGSTVDLVLHSTYWSALRSSAPHTLQPIGAAVTSAAPGCVPGQGCGTVTARFLAAAAGRVVLSATRTVCGEALPCAPGQRSFAVTVLITG
ncbi:hypothetical protein ABUW04_11215 [Streptacidiphilus sp. N1-10]|uniref:Proteinase inhibitor I42 chagasin domain-containing protein n=1 Tax=Streptacidiphilus jeojiensis TaxID=3229225 RepID=A0ABV6XKP1_9ACTN